MPVCRECFNHKSREQELERSAEKSSAIEVTYGAKNGSPEDEVKLIVSTQRSSTDCDNSNTGGASSAEEAAKPTGVKKSLFGSPMVAAAPFTEDNESPEQLKN